MRLLINSLLLLALPLAGRAAESCLWLNAATASGLLGGSVTATVTHDTNNRDDAVCTFTRDHAEVRIEVITNDPPRAEFTARAAECTANPSPLKAIGNEAVVCGGSGSARVVGRVRNRVFVIRVNGDAGPDDVIREKARVVAEHVAGNLF